VAGDEASEPNALDADSPTTEILSAINSNQLAGDELRAFVGQLVGRFVETGSNGYLYRIRSIHHVEPDAVAPQLPRIGRLLTALRDVRRVCDLLTMLGQFDELPDELEPVIAEEFVTPNHGDRRDREMAELFVKPRAAAVLLKFWPEAHQTRSWFHSQLMSEERLTRLTAISALGLTGPAAEDSLPEILPLLKDESPSVRVTATSVLWKLDQESVRQEELVLILLTSLQDPDETIVVKPLYFSEWLPGHQFVAVRLLALADVRKDDAAQGLIKVLNDDDDVLRHYALEALGKLGHRSDDVIEAVTRKLSDPEPWVSGQAARTLQQLRD